MGKKGKDQRTKNNARPSNSGRSAELLGNSPFFGFSAGKDTPIGFATEEIDSSVDPNYSLLLKKMTKKDATTKLKALQEFSELVKASDVDTLKAVLPFWPRAFCALAGDVDHRVREAVHQTQGQVVAKAGRNIAPHLKQIIAPWFVGQCDAHAPAASAARASLAAAFPGAKMADAIAFCQLEILGFVTASLAAPAPPARQEEGDAIAVHQRLVSSALLGYAVYLRALPAARLEPALDANRELVACKPFKKLAKNAAPQVCAAWFSAVAALCGALPALAKEQVAALSASLLALDERDPSALAAAWEAALCLACAVPECWSHVSLDKAVLPKLWHLLREGCFGNAGTILPSLLPLISKIPVAVDASAAFYDKLFDNLRTGSRCRGVLSSRSETGAFVRCYLECLGFCLMRAQNDVDLCTRLIQSHLGSLVASTLTSEPAGALSCALAPALAALVGGWEAAGRAGWAEAALDALAAVAGAGPDWALQRQVEFCLALLAPARRRPAGCRVRFQRDADESLPADARPAVRSSPRLHALLCTVGCALVQVTATERNPRALPHLARLIAAAGSALAEGLAGATPNSCRQAQEAGFKPLQQTTDGPSPEERTEPQTLTRAQDADAQETTTSKEKGDGPEIPTALQEPLTDTKDKLTSSSELMASKEKPTCTQEISSASVEKVSAETFQAVPLAALACAWLRDENTRGSDAIQVALAALPHLAQDGQRQVVDQLEQLLVGALAAPVLRATAARCADACAAQLLGGTAARAALCSLLRAACAEDAEAGAVDALERCLEARDSDGGAVLTAETLRELGDIAASLASDRKTEVAAPAADNPTEENPIAGTSTSDSTLAGTSAGDSESEAISIADLETADTQGPSLVDAGTASVSLAGSETALRVLALVSEAAQDDRLLPALLAACLGRPALANAWRALAAGAARSAAAGSMPQLVQRAGAAIRRPIDTLELPDLPRYVEAAWLVSGQSQAGVDSLVDLLGTRLQPIEARLSPLGVPQAIGLGPTASAENEAEPFAGLSLTRCLEVYLNHALFAVCLAQKTLPELDEEVKEAVEVGGQDEADNRPGSAEESACEPDAESSAATEESNSQPAGQVATGEDITNRLATEEATDETVTAAAESELPAGESGSVAEPRDLARTAAILREETARQLAGSKEPDIDDGRPMADVRRHLLRAQACAALCHALSTTYATSMHTAALAPRLQCFQLHFQRLLLRAPVAQARHALHAWRQTPVLSPRGWLPLEVALAATASSAALAARAGPNGTNQLAPEDPEDFPEGSQMPAKPALLFNCEVWRKPRDEVEVAAATARRLCRWLRSVRAGGVAAPTAQVDVVFVSLASWGESVRNSRRFLLAERATQLPLTATQHHSGAVVTTTTNDNAALLAINTCRLATELFSYLALPDSGETKEAQAADWKAVFGADVSAVLENTFVLLADACGSGDLSLLDLPLLDAVCEAVRALPTASPAGATASPAGATCQAALRAVASAAPELQIAAASLLAPPMSSPAEEERAASWQAALAALVGLEPIVRGALDGIRRGQTLRFALHDAHAAEVRGFLLVWTAVLRTCDAANPELRAAFATDLREGGHVAGLLTHVFRLMPSEALHGAKPRACAPLFDAPPDLRPGACNERAVEHLACHVFALALSALPAEVRGWWQAERCCSLVERVTTRHAAHALADRQMRQVAARAAREPLHNMTIRVLGGARELSAVYTVDEAKTELLITLPPSYPLQPVKVEAPGGVASSAQSRAWLMQLALFLTCQNGSLWDGLSMWKAKLDKRFDGVEECYICFAVLSAAGCQLPKVCCRTCKKKFHSACLFKWFTTSNKSTCPICRNLF